MPPLYPKMRERPDEFRINRAWPLYSNLAFCLFVQPQLSLRQADISPYSRMAVPAAGVGQANILFSPQLRRFSFYSGSNTQYLAVGNGRLSIGTAFTVCAFGRLFATPSAYTRIFSKHQPGSYGLSTGISGYGGSYSPPFVAFSTNGSDWNDVFAASDAIAQPYVWRHYAFIRNGSVGRLFLDGKEYVGGDFPKTNWPSGAVFQGSQEIRVASDGVVGGLSFQPAEYADVMVFNVPLPAIVWSFADPSNVDLRVGGVPLILPPRRRFWPVAVAEAPPAVQIFSRRQFGPRIGTRQVQV